MLGVRNIRESLNSSLTRGVGRHIYEHMHKIFCGLARGKGA